jgi:hypothetical protein
VLQSLGVSLAAESVVLSFIIVPHCALRIKLRQSLGLYPKRELEVSRLLSAGDIRILCDTLYLSLKRLKSLGMLLKSIIHLG